jgi:succinyldiaminopimelate transaminase
VRVNPLLDQLRTYPVEALHMRRDEVAARGIPIHDFSVGDPPEPTPVFIREALRDGVPQVSQYPAVAGTPELRAAIGGYLRRRFGVDLDPDRHVLPTSGSKEAVFHLPMAVIDPSAVDRVVVFPDPGYPGYERGALFCGGLPHPVPLAGDWRFRPWELPDSLLQQTRVLWVNSPANPTGVVMSREELGRTYELCRAWDILLVCDECYADIYDGEPPPSLLEVGLEGALVIHSLSKRSGLTGYRSGFIAGDPAWIRRMRGFRSNPGLAAQDFVNRAALAAWSEDEHVAARRRRFTERRRLVLDFLVETGHHPVQSDATFYIWFPAPEGYDDLTYAAFLLEAGIVVTPGRFFATTSAADGYLRLALVPSLEGCRVALEAWRALLERAGGFGGSSDPDKEALPAR